MFHAAPIDGLPTLEEADGAGDPWPKPDGLMPPTADPPVPMRTFDDLRIAHQGLIGGALREIVQRGDDGGYLARLVRDLEAALPVSPTGTTALPEKTLIGQSRRKERTYGSVVGWG